MREEVSKSHEAILATLGREVYVERMRFQMYGWIRGVDVLDGNRPTSESRKLEMRVFKHVGGKAHVEVWDIGDPNQWTAPKLLRSADGGSVEQVLPLLREIVVPSNPATGPGIAIL